MLFPNLAKEAVERAKTDYASKVIENWRKGRKLALQYEKGHGYLDYMKLIDEELHSQIPRANNNIVKRIIERISMVYTVPPIRMVDGEPNERYDGFLANVNPQMQRIERRLNLLNVVAVKPTWYGDHIERDLITDFQPHFADDPTTPVAISYPLTYRQDPTSLKPETMMYIDAGGWVKYDMLGKVIDEGDHSYGLLPVYFAFTEKPDSNFYMVDYARDLVDACREINVLTMDRTANVRFQSYGYLWAAGVRSDEDIVTGPNKSVTFDDPAASLNVTTPPDTMEAVTATIRESYKMIARNYHLSEDFVAGTVQAESGVALKLRNQELADDRKGDVERAREMEAELYKIEQQILRIDAGVAITGDFSVDSREDEIVESPEERRARWEWEVDKGYKTWAQVWMEMNPDKFATEAEAQAAIDANKEANSGPATLSKLLSAPVAG